MSEGIITVKPIDTKILSDKLASLHDALLGAGKDASNVVRDEGRRLTRTIVNFIPPIKSRFGNAKQSGEAAISRELSNLFSEAQPELIQRVTKDHGASNVHSFITDKNGGKTEILWDNVITPDQMPAFHKKNQNNRGKVPLVRNGFPVWTARVIVPQGTLKPYIKAVQKNVGYGKGSMAKAGIAMGDKYPAWIADKTGNNPNAIVDVSMLADVSKPSVTFGTRTPGINRLGPRIQAAVKMRARAVGRRIKLLIEGYKGDFNKSSKAATKFRNSTIEPEEFIQ